MLIPTKVHINLGQIIHYLVQSGFLQNGLEWLLLLSQKAQLKMAEIDDVLYIYFSKSANFTVKETKCSNANFIKYKIP